MFKKIIFLCVFLLSIILVNKESISSNDFNLIDLVHAQESNNEESNETDYISGSEMGEISIQVGVKEVTTTVGVGPYGATTTIITYVPIMENISCCIGSNSKTACDFNAQDERC